MRVVSYHRDLLAPPTFFIFTFFIFPLTAQSLIIFLNILQRHYLRFAFLNYFLLFYYLIFTIFLIFLCTHVYIIFWLSFCSLTFILASVSLPKHLDHVPHSSQIITSLATEILLLYLINSLTSSDDLPFYAIIS